MTGQIYIRMLGAVVNGTVSMVEYSMPLNKVEKLEKHSLVFIANNEKIRVQNVTSVSPPI